MLCGNFTESEKSEFQLGAHILNKFGAAKCLTYLYTGFMEISNPDLWDWETQIFCLGLLVFAAALDDLASEALERFIHYETPKSTTIKHIVKRIVWTKIQICTTI